MSQADSSYRYCALDAVRGLTIALMILVNTPGSWSFIYSPFQHADWHGCTPTDLIFPFFLFVVGSAMFFSFNKSGFVWSGARGLKILRRTVIIFAIGLALNAFPFNESIAELRILGVLQRIALAYGIAAVLVLCFARVGIYVISITVLLGYWLLLWWGGGSDPYGLTDNVVVAVDLQLLGAAHLWMGKGIPFDPEGLLSSLPAVVNVLIGFEMTRAITAQRNKSLIMLWLIGGGTTAILLGLLWGLWLPINKSLWTSSFVIYTAGYFSWVLAFFIWLVDVKKHEAFASPFLVYGSNPLFIYVLAIVWVKAYSYIPVSGEAGNFYQALFLWLCNFFQPLNASLVFALVHVVIFWLISLFLFKKKVFIKV